MYKKACLLLFSFIAFLTELSAQSTYLPLNTPENQLLDKLETRSGKLSDTLFMTTKPISRKQAVDFAIQQRENARYTGLSEIDRYNISQLISENGEWAPDGEGAIFSKHPWFHTFYQTQYDFIHVKTNNFFLSVNPIISGEVLRESNTAGTGGSGYWTSRGAEIRGWICKKVGFYTSVTDNQEKPPSFVNSWIMSHQAVPGADYFLNPGNSNKYDYLLATGYFNVAVIKDHMDLTFGYGKNFIGDGIRSMFLSDFSSSMPYLRLTTRIWKINYENLYMELTPEYSRGADTVLPHKYATMHHLSMDVTKWLNIGLFESIIYGRESGYEIAYLNPIIFLGSMEQFLGSADKKHLGINFKAVTAKHLQFYGQFLLDEFQSKNFFSRDGWWGNKWALQLGGKYYDAFGLKNLELQGEMNVVRPFTYTHSDSIANYTNYNQPLADPLGANFMEFIGIARYQPMKKLFLTLKGMYYTQGIDTSSNTNYGSNIFLNYNTRMNFNNPADNQYGYRLLNGIKATCELINFNASYELRPNLFIDLGVTHRIYNVAGVDNTSTYPYFGVRLNIARRDYDFY